MNGWIKIYNITILMPMLSHMHLNLPSYHVNVFSLKWLSCKGDCIFKVYFQNDQILIYIKTFHPCITRANLFAYLILLNTMCSLSGINILMWNLILLNQYWLKYKLVINFISWKHKYWELETLPFTQNH